MPSNTAAWFASPKAPVTVSATDFPEAGENEVVIKAEAVAINPIEWLIQDRGPELFPDLKYPYIGGADVAGEVVAVGPGVDTSRVQAGNRVLGLTLQLTTNEKRDGAFQNFVVLKYPLISVIPPTLASKDAAVLPLGVPTAAAGLYQPDCMDLDFPSLEPRPKGKTVLIWAGSSSVGCNAIQLAVASGYEVFTTCSPKNFKLCQELGASRVFDYSSPNVTEDLVEACQGKEMGGAFAILSPEPCIEVVRRSKGAKFVAMAMHYEKALPEGVHAKFVFATTIKDNEVSKAIFENYLPRALTQGKYRCAPEPAVVGNSLGDIQAAVDLHRKGVSAKKLVVTL